MFFLLGSKIQSACVLILLTGSIFHMGCSAPKQIRKNTGSDEPMCTPSTREMTATVAGEKLAWCADKNGRMTGQMKARYRDGRPKVFLRLRQGKPDGLYRAWHPNGRRAVRQTYRNGQLVGRRTFWTPIGPPMECFEGNCSEIAAVLGRPLCQPNHISRVFREIQPSLDRCIERTQASQPLEAKKKNGSKKSALSRSNGKLELGWWLDMKGHPYSVKVLVGDDTEVTRCITGVVARTRFPVPFGETCHIRIPFGLGN